MANIIDLPSAIAVRDQSFRFVQSARVSRTRGRVVDAEVLPFPYWQADFDLPPLLDEDFGRYESFIIKVRVGGSYFRAYKTYRPRPLKMNTGSPLSGFVAGGSTPFTGVCSIASIVDPLTVSINGLPSSFIFTEGDMVEFRESDDVISLHMISEDATSDASGAVTLSLNNPIHQNVITDSAVVNFEKASCLMQIVEQPDQSRGVRFGQASFSAMEISV